MQHNKKMCILNENEKRLATIVMLPAFQSATKS